MGLTERSFLERMEEMGFTARKTNGDRIRAMTDDMQLAIFFASVFGCPYDREIALDKCESWSNACVSCWLDWLKQEVTD